MSEGWYTIPLDGAPPAVTAFAEGELRIATWTVTMAAPTLIVSLTASTVAVTLDAA